MVKVKKWENDLAVIIPSKLATEINLSEGSEMNINVVDGSLVVQPKKHQKYTLDELVKQITPENIHSEIDTGNAVGNEVW